MGLAIDREQFDTLGYRGFSGRLDECLAALERLLARPGAEAGPATVGAELELNLTPAPLAGRPFAAFASELEQALAIVRRAAARRYLDLRRAGDPVSRWPLPAA